MSLTRIYGLFLRHFYLISRAFPTRPDRGHWPSIQITLWGLISNFFAANSNYYSGAPDDLIKKHGRKNLEEVFLELVRTKNEFK